MSAPDPGSASPRIAAMPMYDMAEVQAANDALWAAIALRLEAEGISDAPAVLTRGRPLDDLWTDRRLLLAQTCGYPLASWLKDQVQVVATPRYGAAGCEGPFYRSVVVVRTGDPATCLADLKGRRCAVNDWTSNSGMNLLRVELAPLARRGAFFGSVAVSGAHEASAEWVADGQADTAAIDCVTWAHLTRWRPVLTKRLRILAWTVQSPALPFITARGADARTQEALRKALKGVEQDPGLRSVRTDLMLHGFDHLPASHYHAVLHLEQIAAAQGYPQLA